MFPAQLPIWINHFLFDPVQDWEANWNFTGCQIPHFIIVLIPYINLLNRSWIIMSIFWGWSGGVKVSCFLCHLGVQLILAYSWARPAILVAGKGRWGMFLFLLFLHFCSCSSFFPVPLFHLLCCLFYLFSPFLWERHKMTHKGWRVLLNPNTVNKKSLFLMDMEPLRRIIWW